MRVVAVATAVVITHAASAATIQRINKDFTQIVVSLSSQELADLEVDAPLTFEYGRDRLVGTGKVDKLNVVKKSALISLDLPDRRLKKKQDLRFVSFFFTPITSPLLTSPAQFHQYHRSSAEGSVSIFGTDLTQEVDKVKTRFIGDGVGYEALGHLIISPDLAGVFFAFERRDVLVTTRQGDQKATRTIGFDLVKPSLWLEVMPRWRMSLGYYYTAMDLKYGSGEDVIAYKMDFFEPHIGFVRFDGGREIGIHYKLSDAFTAIDSDLTADNQTIEHKETRRLPAALDLHFRDVLSPLFVWGANLGYVFHERLTDQEGNTEPKAAPYEMLKLGTSFEHRLAQGAKLDWRLSFDGAKVPTLSTEAREVNTLGVDVSYYQALAPGLLVGGLTQLAGGLKDDRIDGLDPVTGEAGKRQRKGSGYLFNFQLLTRYEFDLSGYGRRL